MIVMKTASNFQYMAPVTSEVIRVATPGPTQSDLAGLPWKRAPVRSSRSTAAPGADLEGATSELAPPSYDDEPAEHDRRRRGHRRRRQLQRPAGRHAGAAHVRHGPRARCCGTSTATSTSTTPPGMGPMILGHRHPAVIAAVRDALDAGQLFAGQNRLEAEFAEMLVGALPWVESIRIGLTGTEMDLLAVRIARAATGRQRVVRFVGHYHGWLDPLFIDGAATPEPFGSCRSPPASRRPPPPTWSCASGTTSIRWPPASRSSDVACVVMEPVMCNIGLIAPAAGLPRGRQGAVRRARCAARHRRGDHRLPPRPDRRPGPPRHPRRHLDLRQGDRVRVPARRARARPPTCSPRSVAAR